MPKPSLPSLSFSLAMAVPACQAADARAGPPRVDVSLGQHTDIVDTLVSRPEPSLAEAPAALDVIRAAALHAEFGATATGQLVERAVQVKMATRC